MIMSGTRRSSGIDLPERGGALDPAPPTAPSRPGSSGGGWGTGETLAVISATAYAGVNALLRAVAPTVDPYVGSLVRQLPLLCLTTGAVLVTRPAVLWMRPGAPASHRLPGRHVVLLLAAGITSFAVGNVLLLGALSWVGLAIGVAASQGGIVIGGAIVSTVALGEPPALRGVLGAAIVAVGLVLTAFGSGGSAATTSRAVLGFLAAAAAGACYTIANTASRTVQRRRPAFLAALALTNIGGVVALTLICLGRAGWSVPALLHSSDQRTVLLLLAAGTINAVAIGSVTLAVRYTTVASVSTISALVIVLGLATAVAFFDERLSVLTTAGALVIVVGIVGAHVALPRRISGGTPVSAAPPSGGTS